MQVKETWFFPIHAILKANRYEDTGTSLQIINRIRYNHATPLIVLRDV